MMRMPGRTLLGVVVDGAATVLGERIGAHHAWRWCLVGRAGEHLEQIVGAADFDCLEAYDAWP